MSKDLLNKIPTAMYTLKNPLQNTFNINIRCKETIECREADDMFCHPFPDFWDEKYLENNKCCTQTRNPVFSIKKCKDKETNLWGSWSSWSEVSGYYWDFGG